MNREEETIVIPDALREQFAKAYENHHVIFFSAPCGMGKTAMAHVLTAPYKTMDETKSETAFCIFEPRRASGMAYELAGDGAPCGISASYVTHG